MAGYTRQSAADIVPTAVVRSAPVNAEFNALRDAFSQTSGHKHDGTTAEGAYIPTISDTNNRNKVVVNSTDDRLEFFVEVGSSAVEQIRIQDGVVVPVTDNDIDLGTTTVEFKNLFLDGTAKIDTLVVDEDATIAGTLDVTGLVTLPNVDINGGAIDGTVIGSVSAQTITGTNITATTGFFGDLTGNVTGNVTGDVTGNVTGNVTGDLTGNVTAATGSSSFNNVTINGSLNMNAGTAGTVTGLSTPVNGSDAATKTYVDTSISNLVDSAPGALDTLNELSAALGDDPNFATTVTDSIATKLPLAGGTMSGTIAMGTNKITGLGDPTANQDAATKLYVDNQDALQLSLTGGTMTGNIVMGANKVTSTATPTAADDLTRKAYVDSILGSATSAADSAAAASISESNAAASASAASTSASNASTSESNAAASAASSAASFDSFDDRYLGAKSADPTLDNDGDPLIDGAMYFNTVDNVTKVYDLGTTTWFRTIPTTTDQANIDTVSGIAADVTTVAGIASDTSTVASVASDVSTVAADEVDIGTVATNITNVNTVAGISANVTTVAGISADVTSVAADATDIGTVSSNIANVNTVAGISANVTTVAGITSNISAVVADEADIGTVATNITDVNTVATNILDVSNVSDNMATVTDAAGSLTTIQTAMLQMATAFTNSQTRYITATAFA